jgi:monoamine oxidase
MYDTVIVGGGLAGLTVARELAARESVCIVEQYGWGGRAATHRDPQYEIGAGRIYRDHARVNELVKRYNLHTFPITTETYFEGAPNPFLDIIQPLLAILESLDPKDLSRHTIAELIPTTLAPMFAMYPYYAELHMLRADLALEAFRNEMGAGAGYYGIVEGIQTLAHHLAADAKKRGATMKDHHKVLDITRDGEVFEVTGTAFTLRAKRVVIATCRCSLNFPILQDAPFLKQVATSPLIRIYAMYPTDRGVWFKGLPKTVTSGKLRYVIPINETTGLIMVSYTDGPDTDYWRGLDGRDLNSALMTELVKEFPDRSIPNPTYVKKHDWTSGCSYWLPGDYDVQTASRDAHNPSKNLYVCGESISLRQAWLEGALESAATLLSIL